MIDIVFYKELEKETITLPMYRSMYLEKLLEQVEDIEVEKEQTYTTMVREIEAKGKEDSIPIPKAMEPTLRYYQKAGYKWLTTIDRYQFGGILADDMGLRKNHTNSSHYFRISTTNQERGKTTFTCSGTKFSFLELAE